MMRLFILICFFGLSSQAAQKNIGTKSGRFQLIQLSDMRRDQFLVDSETGMLWSSTCLSNNEKGDCISLVWMKESIEDITISKKQIQEIIKNGQ